VLYIWAIHVYVACICLLSFLYEYVHYSMYLSVYVLCIKFRKNSVCICFNCMKFEKNVCDIAQLDARYVTIC
jgi:hypothetical protein